MYNESIDCNNKIITSEALQQILTSMGEKIKKYKKIYENERMRNQILEYNYQTYTFKDERSKMSAYVDFYDGTNIKFDNYDGIMGAFYNRLSEI